MAVLAEQTAALWPLAVYFGAILVMVGTILATSYVLGERHRERATGTPYESGMVATGSAWLRFAANFYLMAMLFVIFDLESVFLFAWAVAVREVGWAGYVEAVVFVGILVVALMYLWRVGALETGTRRQRQARGGSAERPARDSVGG